MWPFFSSVDCFMGRIYWRWSCINTPLLPFLWFLVALKMIYKLHFHFIGYPAVIRLQSLFLIFCGDFAFSFGSADCISNQFFCSRKLKVTIIALFILDYVVSPCRFSLTGMGFWGWIASVLGQLELCFLDCFC